MDKEAWVRKVAEELHERLGSRYHLELTTREKEDVIEIQKEGDVTGIVLNLACYEEAEWSYREDNIKKTAERLEAEYRRRRDDLQGAPLLSESFDQVKHMVVYVLEKRAGNEEALLHIPYEEFFDLVTIYELHLHKGSESYRRVINNDDMKQWGIDKEELLKVANVNTPLLYPPAIGVLETDGQLDTDILEQDRLKKLLFGMSLFGRRRLLVLTSLSKQYGAGCIFYDGILEQIAEAWQDDVVIFVTSSFETLLFPYQNNSWTLNEWMELSPSLESMGGLVDWTFFSSAYRYSRADKAIQFIRKGKNRVENLTS